MKVLTALALALALTLTAAPSYAQARGRAPRTGAPAGQAVPRTGASRPVVVAPRVVTPYRYYAPYYPYYPWGLSLGFYTGYPYGYFGGYYGLYGAPYGYGVGAGYPGYGYAVANYGAVRIEGAARDAQVYADGYYVGIVDDFDGTFQHLNLTPGAHRIEIRPAGGAAVTAFDVRIEPGQTLTYHAN